MKSLIRFTLAILLFSLALSRAQASAYTNLYVFGDSLSAITNNATLGSLATNYWNKHYCNGRVWVEVLAQYQQLPLYPTNITAYFDNVSSNVVTQVNSFNPANASNALVVLWVNNADLFDSAINNDAPPQWTNAINLSLTNHFKIVTNLYSKGVRTLVMPNAVDLSMIPAFNTSGTYTNTIRQQCLAYNVKFNTTLNQLRAGYPGLTIIDVDFYTLLNSMLANAANYGLTNRKTVAGLSIDVISNTNLPSKSFTGSGTNSIFWDDSDPTAMVHYWMASTAQQKLSPMKINGMETFTGSNRLDLANVPAGLTNSPVIGQVLGVTNLAAGNWTTNISFSSTNMTQSVFVPVSGPQWFYKLSFPVVWTWP